MATRASPTEVGIPLANRNWQVVQQFIGACCGIRLGGSACTRYLHRLGFARKRPKERLLKADEAKRAAFVAAELAVIGFTGLFAFYVLLSLIVLGLAWQLRSDERRHSPPRRTPTRISG